MKMEALYSLAMLITGLQAASASASVNLPVTGHYILDKMDIKAVASHFKPNHIYLGNKGYICECHIMDEDLNCNFLAGVLKQAEDDGVCAVTTNNVKTCIDEINLLLPVRHALQQFLLVGLSHSVWRYETKNHSLTEFLGTKDRDFIMGDFSNVRFSHITSMAEKDGVVYITSENDPVYSLASCNLAAKVCEQKAHPGPNTNEFLIAVYHNQLAFFYPYADTIVLSSGAKNITTVNQKIFKAKNDQLFLIDDYDGNVFNSFGDQVCFTRNDLTASCINVYARDIAFLEDSRLVIVSKELMVVVGYSRYTRTSGTNGHFVGKFDHPQTCIPPAYSTKSGFGKNGDLCMVLCIKDATCAAFNYDSLNRVCQFYKFYLLAIPTNTQQACYAVSKI